MGRDKTNGDGKKQLDPDIVYYGPDPNAIDTLLEGLMPQLDGDTSDDDDDLDLEFLDSVGLVSSDAFGHTPPNPPPQQTSTNTFIGSLEYQQNPPGVTSGPIAEPPSGAGATQSQGQGTGGVVGDGQPNVCRLCEELKAKLAELQERLTQLETRMTIVEYDLEL